MTLAAASITTYGAGAPDCALVEAASLYRATYAEHPYNEDECEFADFAHSLALRTSGPNFRLVIARDISEPVGFAMGHGLGPGTNWWKGALVPLPADFTAEREGRTYAVIEIAVLREYRRQGYARALHAHLLAGLDEERATLLVRPDAEPAHRAYEAWSYRLVGQLQPFRNAPVYDVMIRPLR